MSSFKGNESPLQPSPLAHAEAAAFYPGIATSALRYLAVLVLKAARMKQPLPDRASCVAVIRGITPARRRKRVPRDPEIVLGRAQYDR